MSKKTILVVDNEPDIVMLLETRLEAEGHEILKAYSGDEALESARKHKPDLIIMDVMMPPPNGYQVCRTLRDDPEYTNIPIILLTAKSTESDKFWGLESGANAYITKPYKVDEFLGKVESLIKT